jgi:hypothetical protein
MTSAPGCARPEKGRFMALRISKEVRGMRRCPGRDSNVRSGLVNSGRLAFDGGVAVWRGDRAYATAVYEDVALWTLETCMRHPPFALVTTVQC